MNKKDKYTIEFAFVVAAMLAYWFFFGLSGRGRFSFIEGFIGAITISAIFILFVLAAYLSGGRKWHKNDIIVNPWFGLFVAGAFFLFWFGALYTKNIYYGGFIAVAMWGAALLSIWGLIRIIKRQKRKKA